MKKLIRIFQILLAFIALTILVIVLLYGHSDMSVEELKEKYANQPSSFIPVGGMDVHFRDEGPATDSLPLVLLHGTSSSLHTFDALTEQLKKNKRIIRLDLPGFGLTGPFPDRDYSIDHYSDFLVAFLREKGIDKCILAGNSLGGHIAWEFTLKYPELIERLILIDAAGFPRKAESTPHAFSVARIPVLNKLMTYITPRSMVRTSVENVFEDEEKVTDELVDRYFDLSLREGNRQALVDRFSAATDTSKLVALKTIQQPTLIIWGAQDRLIPLENAYKFQREITNSTLSIIPGTGHVPMEENPDETFEILHDFMRKGH